MQTQNIFFQKYFPRGLYQPPGSFRFSLDALLLASFAEQSLFAARAVHASDSCLTAGGANLHLSGGSDFDKSSPSISLLKCSNEARALNLLDLGCGCGVVGFALMLRNENFVALGLDMQPELVQAAGLNAKKLGLESKYQAFVVNLENVKNREDYVRLCLGQEQDLVTANPPYRLSGTGRLPKSILRQQALFGTLQNLKAFVHVAAIALSDTGYFCVIFPFSRKKELLLCLTGSGLVPVRELYIYNRTNETVEDPIFILVASQKKAMSDLKSEQLTLYQGTGTNTVLTDAALSFCSFLACNA